MNLFGYSLNGSSNPKPRVNTSEAPSNSTSIASPYFQILVTAQLCGMKVFSFLTIPTTIIMYLLPFSYYIFQLTRNPAEPPKTVGVYSKYIPFVFPASYLLIYTYMMSASFVSFLLIISGFVISTLIFYSWVSRLFPRKLGRASLIFPTDCNDPKAFLTKCTKLSPVQRLIRLGLLSAIFMADSIPNVDLLQYQSFKK